MPNQLYVPGKEGFLTGEIDYDTGAIKAALIRGYTFNAAHKFLSDITAPAPAGGAGSIVQISPALATKTFTGGAADAADTTFPAVSTGTAIPFLVLFQASAPSGGADLAATGQRLIAFIDTATGLPVTPNGGDITIQWANVTPLIFSL